MEDNVDKFSKFKNELLINDESLPGSEQKESMEMREHLMNLEKMIDVEATVKMDNGIMDNLVCSDESYPHKIEMFEDNLKFLRSSKKYDWVWGNTSDVMSSKSKKEMNDKSKLGLGIGSDNVVNRAKDSGSEKGKDSLKVHEKYNLFNLHELVSKCYKNKESIYSPQDPFIFNLNLEDFPLNLSESSSEDESNSTKKNTKKFPTIKARDKSGYKSCNTEDVGSKTFSPKISRDNKRNLSESSSDDESNLTKENTKKIPTIRVKSVSDGSRKISSSNMRKKPLLNNWYTQRNKTLSESDSEEENQSFRLEEIPPGAVGRYQQGLRYRMGGAKLKKFNLQYYRA